MSISVMAHYQVREDMSDTFEVKADSMENYRDTHTLEFHGRAGDIVLFLDLDQLKAVADAIGAHLKGVSA